jgi:hypothetical protein
MQSRPRRWLWGARSYTIPLCYKHTCLSSANISCCRIINEIKLLIIRSRQPVCLASDTRPKSMVRSATSGLSGEGCRTRPWSSQPCSPNICGAVIQRSDWRSSLRLRLRLGKDRLARGSRSSAFLRDRRVLLALIALSIDLVQTGLDWRERFDEV